MSQPTSRSDGNNPAIQSTQNKTQLLEATMRNVPKLKELNYTQWKNAITNSIKNAKLWDYVDGTIEQPLEEQNNDLPKYFDEAGAVRNAILGSLEPRAQLYIEEDFNPRDAWLTLEKKYLTSEADADAKLISIEKQLAELRLEEGGDIIEHIAEFCRMRSQLNGTRFAIDEQASVTMLYRSLPPGLRPLVVTSDGAEMKDLNALCARLSYVSQNPATDDTPSAPIEDYTNWGVPKDIKSFGLTGSKNSLLEERAAATCRDCLLKDHKAGTPECPQYEWRRELWGEDAKPQTDTSEGDVLILTWIIADYSYKKFSYEFSEPTEVILDFSALRLKEHLIKNFNHSNLRAPHGAQQCAILPAISGRNTFTQAPPETGRTTALIISVAQLTDASRGGIQALIISPTEQKASEIQSMSKSLGYKCYASVGKQSIGEDLAELAKGHQYPILAGTPERILQLLHRNILRATEVKTIALDDLDKLVENKSNLLVSDIYRSLPHSIQTIGTCTTLPTEALKEIISYINNPLYISIGIHEGELRETMTHAFIVVPDNGYTDRKEKMLREIVSQAKTRPQVAILCNTYDEVRNVQPQFQYCTHGSRCTSKAMDLEEHYQAFNLFRRNNSHLVTTCSVPSKRLLGTWSGENFWVVNYNVPSSPQNYIERINYLGFCCGKNTAITLVNDGTNEINTIREIEQYFDIKMVELSWDGSNLI